jgi:hypothetical protein
MMWVGEKGDLKSKTKAPFLESDFYDYGGIIHAYIFLNTSNTCIYLCIYLYLTLCV